MHSIPRCYIDSRCYRTSKRTVCPHWLPGPVRGKRVPVVCVHSYNRRREMFPAATSPRTYGRPLNRLELYLYLPVSVISSGPLCVWTMACLHKPCAPRAGVGVCETSSKLCLVVAPQACCVRVRACAVCTVCCVVPPNITSRLQTYNHMDITSTHRIYYHRDHQPPNT